MHVAPGGMKGNAKTMFALGLLAGIAVCTTIALVYIVIAITSGKGLSLNLGTSAAAAAPAAPAVPTAAADPTQQQAAAAGPVKPVDDKTDHIRGAKNAKVTLIEYSDFECPYCKQYHDTVEQALRDYPNDVRLVYRHFPLSFHQNAEKEAEASECVAELGGNNAFWAFHDYVFQKTTSNGTGFALDQLSVAAKQAGVDPTKFQNCLDSGKYAAKVAQDESEGSAAGVTGTPSTFVNGTILEGAVPYAQLKSAIDAALAKH